MMKDVLSNKKLLQKIQRIAVHSKTKSCSASAAGGVAASAGAGAVFTVLDIYYMPIYTRINRIL
jgi:hypothetical protein